MKKERLIIRNFGPIKDVELDLGRFNILIGEQATGKSTVAKVLAVCRYFSYIIGENNFFDNQIENGLEAWGLKEFVRNDSYIYYRSYDYAFTAKRKKRIWTNVNNSNDKTEEFVFETLLEPLSPAFENLMSELGKIRPKDNTLDYSDSNYLNWTIPTSFFLNDVKKVMDNPFYLPTERGLQSIFSIGQTGIQNLQNFLFNYFSKIDGALRYFKTETDVEPFSIKYVNQNGIGYIRKNDETNLHSLRNAASGYQSTIPIILVVKYQNEVRKKAKTFIIEEPELNLFPAAQNRLIQYLSDRSMVYNSMIFLTTHSPYTLTSLNNLMYAYHVGQNYPEQVSKEIDEKYWLSPDDVSAYMMLPDGTCEDIFDRGEGMIKAEKIDSVSTQINKTFDKLLNIEFKENELNN